MREGAGEGGGTGGGAVGAPYAKSRTCVWFVNATLGVEAAGLMIGVGLTPNFSRATWFAICYSIDRSSPWCER